MINPNFAHLETSADNKPLSRLSDCNSEHLIVNRRNASLRSLYPLSLLRRTELRRETHPPKLARNAEMPDQWRTEPGKIPSLSAGLVSPRLRALRRLPKRR